MGGARMWKGGSCESASNLALPTKCQSREGKLLTSLGVYGGRGQLLIWEGFGLLGCAGWQMGDKLLVCLCPTWLLAYHVLPAAALAIPAGKAKAEAERLAALRAQLLAQAAEKGLALPGVFTVGV